MATRDANGARWNRMYGRNHFVAEEHAKLRQVAARSVGVYRVDRRDVPSGAVHVEHRPPELLLEICGHDARGVTADLQVLPAHHGSVHGVVDDERDRRAVGTLDTN